MAPRMALSLLLLSTSSVTGSAFQQPMLRPARLEGTRRAPAPLAGLLDDLTEEAETSWLSRFLPDVINPNNSLFITRGDVSRARVYIELQPLVGG